MDSKKTRISIIIPTLNEKAYIPILFSAIQKQTYKNYEVILADNGSFDGTREIAIKNNALVVQGGLPSVGRNSGARHSNGEWLVFLDADVSFGPSFLDDCLTEIESKNIDIANCKFDKTKVNFKATLLYNIWDSYKILTQRTPWAIASGSCIWVRKDTFSALNGFDESIPVGEDAAFVQEAIRKKYKYRVLKTFYFASPRRLDKISLTRIIFSSIIGLILGQIKATKIKSINRFCQKLYGGWGYSIKSRVTKEKDENKL